MPDEAHLKRAIAAGLAFIVKEQLPDGGFESFSSPAIENFKPARIYRTNFVPALILAALSPIDTPGSHAIRKRLASFLAGQASPAWSFNYWTPGSAQSREQPYPDDLDDTFCALIGLFLHDPAVVDEQVLAGAVKLLLASEAKVGGPYRTWLVPPDTKKIWQDVDVAVNSNVAYFLALVSNPLPNMIRFIDEAIAAGKLTSPYYPSAYPLVYYAARGYGGTRQSQLVETARSLLKAANTPLDTALAATSLMRLGVNGQARAVEQLLRQQAPDGSWPAAAFCLDPAVGGQPYYNGAGTLTTAFVLETLARYRIARAEGRRDIDSLQRAEQRKSKKAVLALAEAQTRKLMPELRTKTTAALNKLADSGNGSEIIGLPWSFNQSLHKPLRPASEHFFERFGAANLYGWLAYTIYDDFLDGAGQPDLLPTATVALRNSVQSFSHAIPARRSFRPFVDQVFDAIDGANAWELTHCRFKVGGRTIDIGPLPDYGDLSKLAERSLGHTLVPLAILSAKGFRQDSKAFRQTRKALSHYLIVRQMNDDLHDWQTDLADGHISYVIARILEDMQIRPGSHRLSSLSTRMRRQFWYETLPALCEETREHINMSRRAIETSTVFRTEGFIGQQLDRLETSIAEAAASQHKAINFLGHFSGKAVKR